MPEKKMSCLASSIINNVEDEGRTNNNCVKHIPVFRDEHRKSKGINPEEYFKCKD